MNQAKEQFMFDLQLFNEGDPAPAEPAPQETPADPPAEPQNTPAATPEDSPVDYSELGKAKHPDQQLAFLKKNGFIDTEKQPEGAEPPKTEESPADGQAKEQPPVVDPEVEIKVNGEVKKVKQSELVELAQKGADYTRKTQELADQRRQLDLLLQQQAGTVQKPPAEQTKPADRAAQEYKAIVAQTEKNLGLEPGGFNQFDAVHQFELQRVTVQHNSEQVARQQVEHRLNSFVQTANQDPLTPQVDANFDAYIYKMGAEGGDGAAKANAVMSAKTRFLSGTASMADLDLLESHWNYVKAAIATPVTPPASPKPTPVPAAKPQVEPPKTEAPGNGVAPTKERINYEKLGSLKQSDQLAVLRKAGFFKRG